MGLLPNIAAGPAAGRLRAVARGGQRGGRLDHLGVRARGRRRCAHDRRRRGPVAAQAPPARPAHGVHARHDRLGAPADLRARARRTVPRRPAARRLLRHRVPRGREPHGTGQARPRASRSCCPASRSRTSSACPAITWLGQAAGWRVAYLAVAGIFALTFVAVALAVPWQAGDPYATMKRELRAFSRAAGVVRARHRRDRLRRPLRRVQLRRAAGDRGDRTPAGDGAGGAHRVRPRHDDRQPRGRTTGRLERPPQHVRVLRGPRRSPRAARLHGGEPRRARSPGSSWWAPPRRPCRPRSRRGSWTSPATASRSRPRSTTRPSTSATASAPCSAASRSPAASATSPRSGSASCSRSRA